MARKHHKSGRRLSQIKKSQQHFKQELRDRLSLLDDHVYNLTQGQQFYQQALISLANSEQELDWQIGALVVHQQLRLYGDQLLQQLTDLRQWVNQ